MAGIGDIAREAGVKYEDTAQVFEGVRKLLRKGEKITLQDFGTFSVKDQAARVGRNPSTGEPVQVPAKTVPKFKFNYIFKQSIAEALPVNESK